MEKLISSKSEDIPPIKVYIDDLENIVSIVSEVSKNIKIVVDNFKVNDLSEIHEMKRDTIKYVHILTIDPYFSLEMDSWRVSLVIGKDDPLSRGVYEQVKNVLLSRTQPLYRITHSKITAGVLGGTIFVTGISTLENIIKHRFWYTGLLYLLGFIFSATLYKYVDNRIFKYYSIIIPKHKIDYEKPFVKRNKDKILLAIISAILGSIITVIITYISGIILK